MNNPEAYPLKYAMMAVTDKSGRILEAGCGAGRILRYYHDHGYDIVGMDYIEEAIKKLKSADPTLKVETGDITNLTYRDQSFKYVLAFGLYHNLESSLKQSIDETYRVLEKGGIVCASFRADNIQTRITDWLASRKQKTEEQRVLPRKFHKMNLTKREFSKLFSDSGFKISTISPVENMPFLYKFPTFRSASHKQFDENRARAEGYKLSRLGHLLQDTLMRAMPDQFCNIYVLIAQKL
ncbi:class I SAM-dependent methyltransferase [Castellaniella sp.]|uniref:class I SAM-dependent methyltransferase n=1 Tax=Castellaniella sp. TaxID=1955812 RepID=UPI003C73B435